MKHDGLNFDPEFVFARHLGIFLQPVSAGNKHSIKFGDFDTLLVRGILS